MAHGADPPQPGNRSGGWRRGRPLASGKTDDGSERRSADRHPRVTVGRPAGGPAQGRSREWSYHGRSAPDGRGFDSPQLHRNAPGHRPGAFVLVTERSPGARRFAGEWWQPAADPSAGPTRPSSPTRESAPSILARPRTGRSGSLLNFGQHQSAAFVLVLTESADLAERADGRARPATHTPTSDSHTDERLRHRAAIRGRA